VRFDLSHHGEAELCADDRQDLFVHHAGAEEQLVDSVDRLRELGRRLHRLPAIGADLVPTLHVGPREQAMAPRALGGASGEHQAGVSWESVVGGSKGRTMARRSASALEASHSAAGTSPCVQISIALRWTESGEVFPVSHPITAA